MAARARLSAAEAAILVGVIALSAAPLVAVALFADGTPTWTVGPFVGDQLQYIAWVRDAGEHLLISNRFDLVPDDHILLHPMFSVAGLTVKLGLSVPAAYLMWAPIAVAALFAGFSAYVRRLLADPWQRAAALFIALFFFTPLAPLSDWTGFGGATMKGGSEIMGYEMLMGAVWTFPTAISVAMMPVFLLCVERILEPERRNPRRALRWYVGWAAAAGLVASWLHPWQGLELLVIVAALWTWCRFERRFLALALPAAATLAPLVYYWVLARVNHSWHLAGGPNHLPHFESWIALSLAPLALPALLGVRLKQLDLQERMLLLWPPAVLAVFLALPGSYIYHVFSGVSLPLAVLAARGWGRVRLPRVAAAAGLAILSVPGLLLVADSFRNSVRHRTVPHVLRPSEQRALEYIRRSPRSGGVLAPLYLGQAVPAVAGRNTWVGHPSWTPDFSARTGQAAALFALQMPPAQARALVRSTGAAFLVSDCHVRADLEPVLRPLLVRVRRFGCAAVYEVARNG